MMRSSVTVLGKTEDHADYVYYNADIINNETRDQVSGRAVSDPQIRFNETRDTALIKDASQYYFSIIRFSMDGPGLDLPLFIPDIRDGTGQTNVNLTSYDVAISYSQTWSIGDGTTKLFTIVPKPRPIIYEPETKNGVVAPTPRTLANAKFRGQYNVPPGTIYNAGDIVSTTAQDLILQTYVGPFYQVNTPAAWSPTTQYSLNSFVSYGGNVYYATVAVPPIGTAPPLAPASWTQGVGAAPTAPTGGLFWSLVTDDLGQSQDLSSRYYWVYTYQHWLDILNETLDLAYNDTFARFAEAWAATPGAGAFPYANYDAFKAAVNVPQVVYDRSSGRFSVYADSDGFGTRIEAFTPAVPPAIGPTTPPTMRLFFNNTLFNLFAGLNNFYWNTTNPAVGPFAGQSIWVSPTLNGPNTPTPIGYTNEILFANEFWTNVQDYRVPPQSGTPPLGYVPTAQQKPYWVNQQDYASTSQLWSPISSIVFTSTLLPIRAESTGAPVVLGSGNLGFSSSTVQSAFQPIITDITLPQSGGSADYRQQLLYIPTAEYRLTDFGASKQDIRNIDIQVYWKNRLDNQLYPITMANLSSVSIKMMFRHKDAKSGKD